MSTGLESPVVSTATGSSSPLKVIIADDSTLYRRLLRGLFAELPGIEVVACAYDGEDCLNLIETHHPDFVTLDMQMPRRDGLSTLAEIRNRGYNCETLIVCTQTEESVDQAMKALNMGALDMILKPSSSSLEENQRLLQFQIVKHVETVRARRAQPRSAPVRPSIRPAAAISTPAPAVRETTPAVRSSLPPAIGRLTTPIECVCVGVSTGGPQALAKFIGALPSSLPVPMFIVQHMPPVFTKSLAHHLDKTCGVGVCEATHGQIAAAGNVYIAPGGKHMRIRKEPIGIRIEVTDDAPVGSCKPSVDYLFQSVDSELEGRAIAVILTGMGSDGLEGCRKLARRRTHIIAQDADSCVVYGMPRQIVENNLANEVLPLAEIAPRIVQLIPNTSRA